MTVFQAGDRVTGLFSPAYSDYEVTRPENLVKIPAGLLFERALGEPIACLVNAQRRTTVQLGDRVALIGAGFMGLGLLQLIRLRGPRRIVSTAARRWSGLALGAGRPPLEDMPATRPTHGATANRVRRRGD